MSEPKLSANKACMTCVVTCKTLALLVYDCVVLSQSHEVLNNVACFGQSINPWICLMINAIFLLLHCLIMLILTYCNCQIHKVARIVCLAIYYLPGAIATFVSYAHTSDLCWSSMNADEYTQQLPFMIIFHTGLHIGVIVIFFIFVCCVLVIIPTRPDVVPASSV